MGAIQNAINQGLSSISKGITYAKGIQIANQRLEEQKTNKLAMEKAREERNSINNEKWKKSYDLKLRTQETREMNAETQREAESRRRLALANYTDIKLKELETQNLIAKEQTKQIKERRKTEQEKTSQENYKISQLKEKNKELRMKLKGGK